MKKENTTTLVEEVLKDTENLEEAITERVREKLNEEFVPKIRSMIQREMDGDEDEEIIDEPIETEQDEYTEEEPLIPDEEEAVEEQEEIPLDDEEEEEISLEQDEGDEDLEFDIEDDDEEEELEMEQEEIPLDDEEEEEIPIEEQEEEDEEWQDDEDEEMPLEQDENDIEFEDEDEIIEVIDDENDEEDKDNEVIESLKRENKKLRKGLQEIRNKLNNALILNEQYKHAQEFFKKYSLTRDQKKTIVDQISKATTMQRIKLVSESLHKMIGVMPQIQKKNPSNSKNTKVMKKQLVKESADNLLKEEIDVPDLFTKDQKANWKKLSGMIS